MKSLIHIVIYFIFLAMLSTTSQAGMRYGVNENLKVIVYSDRLLAGIGLRPENSFVTQLKQRLASDGFPNVEVISLSKPEMTSNQAVLGLADVLGNSPDVVIVQLGETDFERELSLELFLQNYRDIVKFLRQKSVYTIAMGAKPNHKMGKNSLGEVEYEVKKLFSVFEEKIPCYRDTLAGIDGNDALTQSDRHLPNANGIALIVNAIAPMVEDGLKWRSEISQSLPQ